MYFSCRQHSQFLFYLCLMVLAASINQVDHFLDFVDPLLCGLFYYLSLIKSGLLRYSNLCCNVTTSLQIVTLMKHLQNLDSSSKSSGSYYYPQAYNGLLQLCKWLLLHPWMLENLTQISHHGVSHPRTRLKIQITFQTWMILRCK